jgi:flagellar hook protein FlgE
VLRSLFSGISGLRQHQTMMDTVGNNIANVNTAGYKSSSTVFEDTLSQMVKAAGAPSPQAGLGGTNPAQVGLGVRLASITTNFSQGAAQATGRSTDLMVKQGGETLYTRNGSFNFDANGWLVSSSGAKVQGWTANAGTVDTNAPVGDLRLPVGTLLPPKSTDASVISGNLPAGATTGTVISSAMTMYDTQGNEHSVSYKLTKDAAANSWTMDVTEGAATYLSTTVAFDAAGALVTASPLTAAASWGSVDIDISGMSQFGGSNTFAAVSQTGSGLGSLQAFTLGNDGSIVGVFSNGLKQTLGQVALASFNNPPGLEKIGGSMYRNTVNSGLPQVGVAGAGGRGLLSAGNLEMSNVDLASEFTNLIVAQRGFQANSKIITSSDEILQDLVNLKR